MTTIKGVQGTREHSTRVKELSLPGTIPRRIPINFRKNKFYRIPTIPMRVDPTVSGILCVRSMITVIPYSEILPHSSVKTVFNITDKGVHKTDSSYSLVNINLHVEWYDAAPRPFIICDKIELYNDADVEGRRQHRQM